METYIKIIIGIAVIFSITSFYLMFANRPLYCKISMMGGLNSVPAMCLQEALRDLNN